ncbi:MAG: helix-turn-helix domain-containing protein [Okeania sp. SIO3H1]|nr:helix-turn-helix domain-containing protein [Okeania sp. SIO1I7]NEN90204.1 helix-turn-helix domain-containing protein [Okeania sp. SIO3H1]NET25101.1 helix-turn-helix domain-containing protein [Okeania sp. SIO1I7]NET29770.1 helix-turn-helix domain-containing protein [Okeania sp. SIO1I7]
MKARYKYRIYPTSGQKYRERKAIWLCPHSLER